MKHLLKAWREYKRSLCETGWILNGKQCYYVSAPTFEGFMDYLVSKEKKGKRK